MEVQPDGLESLLKRQGYRFLGRNGAVKTCLWLNRAMRGEGACYKAQFYGIESHRCVQMTPTLLCNQACLHCWRPIEIPVSVGEWDSPEVIARESIEGQRKLISGYKGAKTTDQSRFEEGQQPRHVAISLAGEPTLYPYLQDLVKEYHRMGLTTFVVTNGTRPDVVENIHPTQLYMSLDAPDEETYKRACGPNGNLWPKILESLEVVGDHRSRTAIRVTLTKGVNMLNPKGYARLLRMVEPDFVEFKAYMHLGFSRNRLQREAMPTHGEVKAFAQEVAGYLDYKVADEVELSRVVLLTMNGQRRPLW